MDTSKLFTYLINGIAISFSTKGSKADFSAKVKQTKSRDNGKAGKKTWLTGLLHSWDKVNCAKNSVIIEWGLKTKNRSLQETVIFSMSSLMYEQLALGSIHTCDLLGVNYSLNNGLHCTKWAHSPLLFDHISCELTSSIMGCVSIFCEMLTQ